MGAWEPVVTQVWDTVVTPCDCCGQVVPKQLWVADVDGERRQFCSPECEALYRRYIVPRSGQVAP
ncbi:MAG TPA: hypothetical protein VHF90_10080 [Thermoleophilaceae bacterium]|nr:hypothetical protein [Thermoleophilaceae bacterium]